MKTDPMSIVVGMGIAVGVLLVADWYLYPQGGILAVAGVTTEETPRW